MRGKSRPGRPPTPLVALALGALMALPVAAQVARSGQEPGRTEISPPLQPDELGPHGAMTMDAQMKQLHALLPERDVTKPPPTVDPETWAAVVVPADNAMSPERVALGRKLYFDPRLSADGTVSCATCHDTSRAFTDQRPTSQGIGGQVGHRNAPTTMNAALMETQFLDGRAASLEEQAKLPIINPIEMGQPDGATAVAAIAGDAEYQRMFQEAYGRAPDYDDVGRAIAAFERTLVFLDSPARRFLEGDTNAISEQARRGFDLYVGKARCVTCHPLSPSMPIGTDNRFHNVGVSARHQDFEGLARQALATLAKDGGLQQIDELALQTDLSELGRFMVSKDRADIGSFKTMQVANTGVTAPYMHDGTMRTLWDVMDHYNKGGEPNPFLDGGIEPLALTEDEIDAVVAFLFALTDDRFAEHNRAEETAQRRIAKEQGQRPFRDTDLAMRRVLPFEERVMGTGGPKESE